MSSSTTSCGEEKKDDSIISLSPDAVAKRLRDKIRLQAESLLSRCDTVESSILAASRSRDASRQASRDPSLSRSSSRASLAAVDTTAAAATVTTAVVEGATPPTAIISGTDTPNSSNRPNSTSSSSELTKRLQKLAMDRQNSTLHNSNTERLRVIQSDDNNNNHNSHLRSVKTFAELNLPEHLLSALYQMGFDRPSAIQEEALPRILAGRNIIGQAQSGSGKVRNYCCVPYVLCCVLSLGFFNFGDGVAALIAILMLHAADAVCMRLLSLDFVSFLRARTR